MADESLPAVTLIAQSEKKRSAGVLYLAESLPSMSSEAQSLLKQLIQEQGMTFPDITQGTSQLPPPFTRIQNPFATRVTKLIDKTMSDETVLLLAKTHQISFLGSLLKVVHKAESVSTRHCIKQVALAVPPSYVPAHMDAKEMVMAALHFLSSQPQTALENTREEYSSSSPRAFKRMLLPLLKPLGNVGDLEKRCYEKAFEWNLDDIMEEVADLERVFFSNSTEYKWMARGKLCPRLGDAEDLLFLKGNPPTSAAAKRRKSLSMSASNKAPTEKEAKAEDDENEESALETSMELTDFESKELDKAGDDVFSNLDGEEVPNVKSSSPDNGDDPIL